MEESEFDVNNTIVWIYPALYQQCLKYTFNFTLQAS